MFLNEMPEDISVYYNVMIELLEKDCMELAKSLQGDIYDSYKSFVQKEIDEIKKILK